MKRFAVLALFAVAAAVPLLAQSPAGWKVRADRSTSAADPDAAGAIKFTTAGSGFHAVTPQAAVLWKPGGTATGAYTLKGTFTQLKPSSHTNYFGLVFGGENLDGPGQNYLYFTVAQDGTFLVKHRDGDVNTRTVAQSANAAVKKLDATGKSINALEVRVMADKIDYVVNGTVVHSTPKTGMTAKTDGLYGMRVNHALEVQVDGLGVSK